jgi:N-methylhydantoinase A
MAMDPDVSRGWDPRDFAIIPYGGGGAMYACDLARESGATSVVVPPLPGYASAFGAIRVDVKHEFTYPIQKIESELDYGKLNQDMDNLVKRATDVLQKEGLKKNQMVIQRSVDEISQAGSSRWMCRQARSGISIASPRISLRP